MKNISMTVTDVLTNKSVILTGVELDDSHQTTMTSQFQPVVEANRAYTIHFSAWQTNMPVAMPSSIDLSIYNFPSMSHVKLNLVYPSATTTFNITTKILRQLDDVITSTQPMTGQSSQTAYDSPQTTSTYYWDSSSMTLHMTLVNSWTIAADDRYNYCPPDGCRIVNVATP
jgi:hypothetical protein